MTRISLYKLSEDLAEILDRVDPDTGELPEEFGPIRELVANKAAAVAAYISSRELEADAIAERIREIGLRVARQRKQADRLRQYLCECMTKAGITEIESQDKLLKIKRHPNRDEAVEIDPLDASAIPEQFLRIKKEPDKVAIKKAINDGAELPFARLVKKDRLTIG